MKIPNSLQVFLYNRPIGILTHIYGDKISFAFEPDYIENPDRPILSLSYKDMQGNLILDTSITQTRLPPFFSNLLPEGPLRDYLAQRANVNPIHEFSLLAILGQDLPGAITVQPLEGELQLTPSPRSEQKKLIPLRFSLAGLQLKFSAVERANHGFVIPANGAGGEWIIKLPHSAYRGIPENEYSMMELARRIGIDVPEIALRPIHELQGLPPEIHLLGDTVFAIKRFDRAAEGTKLHIEDFAQVFGVYPEKKYKSASYRNIAEVIARESGEPGLIEFVKRLVFNALIGNGDMHLKNWSLLYKEKTKASLAPAYDFVSTILYLPNEQLALSFVGSHEFKSLTLDRFKRFADKAQLPEKLILDTVQETVESFHAAWNTIKDLPIHEDVRKAIAEHLKTLPLHNN